jgi:hypothetical protein
MLEFQREAHKTTATTSQPLVSTHIQGHGVYSRVGSTEFAPHAVRAQVHGVAALEAFERSLNEPQLSEGMDTVQSDKEDDTVQQRRREAANLHVVNDELSQYEAAGINDGWVTQGDILAFWQVSIDWIACSFEAHTGCPQTHKKKFPLLYQIALDVLPVQASAVPCERIFSSAKETDIDRRNKMSGEMMEMLQILKYLFRQDRLQFNEDITITEAKLTRLQDDISTQVADSLVGQNRWSELERVFNEGGLAV